MIEHTGFRIILLPISPTGALVGIDDLYDMRHRGIQSPIDVEGSFWDAVAIPQGSVDFDGRPGTFRLVTSTEAVVTTQTGLVLRLVRHTGVKSFPGCMQVRRTRRPTSEPHGRPSPATTHRRPPAPARPCLRVSGAVSCG